MYLYGCSMAVVSASSVHGGASPSLEQVRQLAQDHNLIPLSETFIDDCQTSVSAFLKLREERPAFLLERGEWVVELDRPARAARRNGGKTDALDAARAAREASTWFA